MLERRRFPWNQQIKVVATGGNPLGVAFDEKDAMVRVPSGNFIKARTAAE